jgi:hypothetical protein
MQRVCIFLTAALLVPSASAAWAEDKPADRASSSAPGAPGVPPADGTPVEATGTLSAEKVILRVDGKIIDAAPPGVAVEVTIRLHNFASEIARDVKVHLEAADGARITDADATYGDLAPGDTADGVFGVVVGTDPCPDFLGLGGDLTHDGSTDPLKIGVPVACPGPRLSIQDVRYTGGDGDGVPEPRESLHVFVVLRNDGHDAAHNVRGTMTVTGKGVSSSSDALAWPDIAPGDAEKSTSGVAITIAEDAPRQEGCPGSPGGVAVIPPAEGGTIPPDATVSSDGSVGSGGNASGEPGSEPGSAGSASPGGSEPTQIEPAPASTATDEPLAVATATTGTGTVEPQPGTVEPAPGTPEPAPRGTEPAPDRPVQVRLQMEVAASGYRTGLQYSNLTVCALEGGAPAPAFDASKRSLAANSAARTSSSVFPIAMTLMLSAAAVAARVVLVR